MAQKVGPEMLEDSMNEFTFTEKISLPVDGTYTITLNSGPRFRLLAVSYALGVGSLTLDIKDDGVTLPDFASISVTTTPGTTNGDGDADDIIAEGSVLSMTVSSASGPPSSFIITFVCKVLPEA